jgi:ribosome-associated translation inhibitor RaiA
VDVKLTADREISGREAEEARKRFEALERYVDGSLTWARLTLRRGSPHARRPYVADASGEFEGRRLAAHAAAESPAKAAEAVADRLRRQLRRVVDSDVARRNEPRVMEAALAGLELDPVHRPEARLKPPEEREIVYRRTYTSVPMGTVEAVAELIDLDAEFLLFRHARTEEDVVVYRRDDGRVGLIHPRNSPLADEDDVVVAEPSRYSEPLTLERARTEMDFLNHRFLYFIDAEDGRGKVLYLRHDGDYGLVEPE